MNFNNSFSSFQETGQTCTEHLFNLVLSPDDTLLNKKTDQWTLFLLQFDRNFFDVLNDIFSCGFLSVLIYEYSL